MTTPLDFGTAVPANWTPFRLKEIATYVNRGLAPDYADGATGALAFNQKCVRPDLTVAPELGRPVVEGSYDEVSPAILRTGDIVINSTGRGTLGRAALVQTDPELPAVADGHVTIVRTNPELANVRFVAYLLGTSAFYEQANLCLAVGATNQTELNRESLRRMVVILPPLDEQRLVANKLDEETGRIDDLIREEQRLKSLLSERLWANRETLLLGPIRDALRGWKRGSLKRFVAVERGRFTHRPRNDPALYGGAYPFIQTGDISASRGGVVESWSQTLNDLGLAASRMAPAGTMVMAIAANIGDVARLGFDACFPDSVVAIAPRSQVTPEYLFELIQALRKDFISTATLNTQLNINIERIGDIDVAIPPVREQRQLVADLARRQIQANAVIREIDHQVALLREHRQALITAGVTGGLDALGRVA